MKRHAIDDDEKLSKHQRVHDLFSAIADAVNELHAATYATTMTAAQRIAKPGAEAAMIVVGPSTECRSIITPADIVITKDIEQSKKSSGLKNLDVNNDTTTASEDAAIAAICEIPIVELLTLPTITTTATEDAAIAAMGEIPIVDLPITSTFTTPQTALSFVPSSSSPSSSSSSSSSSSPSSLSAAVAPPSALAVTTKNTNVTRSTVASDTDTLLTILKNVLSQLPTALLPIIVSYDGRKPMSEYHRTDVSLTSPWTIADYNKPFLYYGLVTTFNVYAGEKFSIWSSSSGASYERFSHWHSSGITLSHGSHHRHDAAWVETSRYLQEKSSQSLWLKTPIMQFARQLQKLFHTNARQEFAFAHAMQPHLLAIGRRDPTEKGHFQDDAKWTLHQLLSFPVMLGDPFEFLTPDGLRIFNAANAWYNNIKSEFKAKIDEKNRVDADILLQEEAKREAIAEKEEVARRDAINRGVVTRARNAAAAAASTSLKQRRLMKIKKQLA